MGGEVLVFISLFFVLFGIAYLHYSTRNKERLALIEKGMDAGIFQSKKETPPIWKVFVLNISLLLMGIGLGILMGLLIQESLDFYNDALFPALIFLMAGAGLMAGFFMTKKYVK